MDNISSLAYEYARKLGIAPSLEGFDRFVQAVTAFASAPVKPKYNAVCRKIGGTQVCAETVEKSIRYALATVKNIVEKLTEITGKHVEEDEIHPKNIICHVADCIRYEFPEVA